MGHVKAKKKQHVHSSIKEKRKVILLLTMAVTAENLLTGVIKYHRQ